VNFFEYNEVTPWINVLFENLLVAQLAKKFPAFYEYRIEHLLQLYKNPSLLRIPSQRNVVHIHTHTYIRTHTHTHTHSFLMIHWDIFSHLHSDLPRGLFLQFFGLNYVSRLSRKCYIARLHLILLDSITLVSVKSASYEAPHFVIFSVLLLPSS
jgi:hypothetical protein